jgi:uncharacterized membrane protein YoaK (UPF0700 family)
MASLLLQIRDRFDRVGMILSGLCLVHCVAGLVIVAGLGLGGGFLLDPAIHRVGLLLAVLVAGAAIGLGALRHRRRSPLVIAAAGLLFMTAALVVDHGFEEAVLTVIGVSLVAVGHLLNLRAA